MYPNRKLGYTLEGGREARYVALGAHLLDDDHGLGRTIEDQQTRIWTNTYCRLLEATDAPDTDDQMTSQAQKAVNTAEIGLPAEQNATIIEGLGRITSLSWAQAAKLRVRRSVAQNMLASLTPPQSTA